MNTNLVRILRRVGWLLFILMWIPFVCVFVGMAQEFGSAGVRFAQYVDQYVPGLLAGRGGDVSFLTLISTVFTFGMMFAAFALMFGAPMLGLLASRRILQTGKLATARVVSISDTGTYINRQPLVRIVMEVQRNDASPFQAETEKVMRPFAQLSVGSTVNVRYDPDTLETAISD